MGIIDFVTGLFKPVDDAINKLVPDKNLAAQLSATIQTELIQAGNTTRQTQGDIIIAEAKSDSWLARNWRPITMLIFVSIIANNYIVAPYAQAIFGHSVSLETPPDLWALIKIGLGGYVVGRSAEKVVTAWASK